MAILNDLLRDRLVCGISDKRVQQRFLQEAKLPYEDALSKTLAAETALNSKTQSDCRKINRVGKEHPQSLLARRSLRSIAWENRRNLRTNEARNRNCQEMATATDVEESIKPPNASLKTTNVIFAKRRDISHPFVAKSKLRAKHSQESKRIESTMKVR